MTHRHPTSRIAELFGDWLRDRRNDLALTLTELVEPTKVAIGWVSELERGLKNPFKMSVGSAIKLAQTYRIKPSALLSRLVSLAEARNER